MLIPSFLLLYLVLTNRSGVDRIFSPEILRKIRLDQGMSKKMRLITLFIALSFMILALARPVYEKGVVEVESKRAYLVIALDISRSMKARDLYPDRLSFAKRKVEKLIEASRNLAIGLVAYAEGAFIVSPITADREALLYLLKHLDTEMLSMKGTNILAALRSAQLLYGGREGEKNILLVTDGGDQKEFKREIQWAQKEGFKVFVLGIGSEKGAPIEEDGHYLTDEKGNIVIVRLNREIEELARATGGEFIKATLSTEDIERLLEKIGGFQRGEEREKIVDRVEFYPYLLTLALAFLFLALFDIPSSQKAFLALLFLSLPLSGGLLDFEHIREGEKAYRSGNYQRAIREFEEVVKAKGSPESLYDLANSYYKAGEYKRALETYSRIETDDRELEFRKLYNMGNSAFMMEEYQKAIEFYEKALEIRDDPDARHNLELAKKMLKRKEEEKRGGENGEERDQKKKEDRKGREEEKRDGDREKEKREREERGKKGERGKSEGRRESSPISDREEKKWHKNLEQRALPTLLYKAPVEREGERYDEHPW